MAKSKVLMSLMAIAFAAGVALGQEAEKKQRRGRGQRGGGMIAKMKEELGLSDEQVGQIQEAWKARAEAMKQNTEAQEARKAMKEARKAGDRDAMREAMTKFRAATKDIQAQFNATLETVLTQEQLEKYRAMRKGGRRKGGKQRGRRKHKKQAE